MYTKKKFAQKFVPAKYTLKIGFAQATCFTILSPILGVWPPYLGAGLECIRPNFLHTNLIHWASKKSMPRRFSASWKHNPKIWGCARNVKIGLASFFVMTYPQKRLCIHLYHKNLVRPQNMGAKLPTQRICHVLPWLRKTHRNWCVVHKHGFGWQIRSTGSSAPIFWV